MHPDDNLADSASDDIVLVTGAGGFVGGHVARTLAEAGCRVRAFTRRQPSPEPSDPPLEWIIGDLRNVEDRRRALAGVRRVVHVASWVSLGSDPRGDSRAINVEATRALLDEGRRAGVERFVYTSTLWAVAAGNAEQPASEESAWNLDPLFSPYSETKREAERLVLEQDQSGFQTLALCPAMVVGPRDVRPTSTRLFLHMARARMVFLPGGGINVIDVRVLAQAHLLALDRAEPGRRYIVAGPYLSYREIAALVARLAGKPRRVVKLPNAFERPLAWIANRVDHLMGGRWPEISAAAIGGGFLQLHVSGALADAVFDLQHPPAIQSIYDALEDQRRSGRAPWLSLQRPTPEDLVPALSPSCHCV